MYFPTDANSENTLQELSDVISSKMTKQPGGNVIVVVILIKQTSVIPVCLDPRQNRKYPKLCVYKYSWQLQSPPTSPLWSVKSYFSASSAYICPADKECQTISKTCYIVDRWRYNSPTGLFCMHRLANRHRCSHSNNISRDKYTSSGTSYISKFVDNVVITKTIRSFPNHKALFLYLKSLLCLV